MNNHLEETAKEADVLNGVQEVITLTDGQSVIIYKCKVKQIGVVLRFLAFLMKSIGMKDLNDQPSMNLSNPAELMMLIADGSDKIYPVACSLCSLDIEQFEDLEIEDAMAIMLKEWDINKDFFLQKVMPMLGRQTAQKSPTSKVSTK
ncbi:MAG: hypothetical protein DRQ47_00340, partial [Gammaproteobacteria bacterium]